MLDGAHRSRARDHRGASCAIDQLQGPLDRSVAPDASALYEQNKDTGSTSSGAFTRSTPACGWMT
jgi:hypothetical protein